MKENKLNLPQFIEQILRPQVNVDGGDIRLDRVEKNKIYLIAGAECADCPACGPDFTHWLENEINHYLQTDYQVILSIEKPYYYQ